MSTYAEARDLINGLIVPAWNTASSNAPIFFDNLPGNPPDPPVIWARLHLRFITGSRVTLGDTNARFRRTGTLFLQIFTPFNDGIESSDSFGEAVVNAIDGAGQVGDVWFRDSAVINVGTGSDGVYYQVNVEADFTFDRVT